MARINWELMRPQDIEIRPAMVKDGKATLLLYQDSRNTMDALDRNFGEFGWKIEYKDVAGQIYGKLSIKDPDTGEWVSKEDTGEESNISAQKGQSSDILKRCAVRFGYGRELYTAPRIKIDDDGYGCSGYKVSNISYNDNREITALTIVNRFGKVVYSFPTEAQNKPVEEDKATILKNFCTEMKPTVLSKDELLKFYNFYVPKMATWKGAFNPDVLWKRWLENN